MPRNSSPGANLETIARSQPANAPGRIDFPLSMETQLTGILTASSKAGFDDDELDANQAGCVGHTALLKRAASARVCGSNTAAMIRTTERPVSVVVTTRPSMRTRSSATSDCSSD